MPFFLLHLFIMEKAKFTPITDYNKPKKTPTNFVNPSSVQAKLKNQTTVGKLNLKNSQFIKKQDDSWEY